MDELLCESGDAIYHRYGTRQEWQRVIRLEAVEARGPDDPRVECVGGPKSLDIEAVNLTLSGFGQGSAAEVQLDPEEVPEPLQRIMKWETGRIGRQVTHLAAQAMIDRPVQIDKPLAIAAVQPFSRLLALIGNDGLELNEYGDIPPVDSAVLFHRLGMNPYWFGRGRAGCQPVPITFLRQAAERHDLITRYLGRLELTALGRDYVNEPLGLFWYLAERVTFTAAGFRQEHAAIMIYLLGAATDTDDPAPAVARYLDDMDLTPDDHPFNTTDDLRRR
ncbi:hypothetical protein [Nocardia seriolae]|uniref:hypothetical protein n=1 Tax=Nocardia seriolae TaxID=37332 RepID=UPI0008F4F972|nr:hypothetical protein [Nocardia seriolae]MTJ62155.1 hypothetical protein [Nocardia seriolae]MTJ76303.1 hypothetical protein [Nocardia seriolae]MTJ87067.1 hypothetical protein [Nocardia seriolae]MTK31062.1 hypothetical protein [Nocardia seriolae]MTK40107.1 hypothetical protein [Nocardia seriolae]